MHLEFSLFFQAILHKQNNWFAEYAPKHSSAFNHSGPRSEVNEKIAWKRVPGI